MSLANKYRPIDFNDVVEQDHIIDILKAHTWFVDRHTNYLFFGPRWTGKTTCARLLAKALNCENPTNWNPCNACNSCKIIDEWKTFDIIEIDAASHTWVDNIREEIIDKAWYQPAQLKVKVYIIDEVHMLSKWAFNALLKIMEEPWDNIRFILATTEIHKVPDTIISRCQVFNFKRIWDAAIIERLEHIAQLENITVSHDALNLIAQMSEWCMRDAIKYMDQVSILWEVSESSVTSFLWVASHQAIENFVNTAIEAKTKNDFQIILDPITTIQEQWIDLSQFTKQILLYIDQSLSKNIEEYSLLADVFSNIMIQSKRYPQPLLLYKTALHSYIKNDTASVWTPSPKQKRTDKIQTIQEKKETETWQPNPQQNQSPSTKNSNQWSDLLTNFINSIDKPSLKSMFDDQSKIKEITWNIVDIIVINPMAKLKVKDKEIVEYLEDKMTQVRWEKSVINFSFMTKEEFINDGLFS